MVKHSNKKIFGVFLALSLLFLAVSISVVSAVEVTKEGTIVSSRGWMISEATPFGIYYGFGSQGPGYDYNPPVLSDIYYFDFATKTNTVVKSQDSQPDIGLPDVSKPTIWSATYSAIVGDNIFISSVYYDYPIYKDDIFKGDVNGIYAIDTKTNTFYLYDRTPFNFFENNLPSPMTAVGNSLYFFVESERRVYSYDTTTKKSTALAELPADVGFGAIVHSIGSNIYITTYKYGEENSLYVYDTLADNFTRLATDKLIPSNLNSGKAVIDGNLYFIGGEDPITYEALSNTVEYDTKTNTFSVVKQLDDGYLGASATSVGGTIYLVGGEVHSVPHLTDNITAIKIAPKDLATTIAEYLCNYYPANVCAEHFLTSKNYSNRGDYISYVAQKTNEFVSNSLITGKEKSEIMTNAAELSKSLPVGKKNR